MLSEWTATGWEQITLIALSASAMYITVILLTRLAGVRSFSKMSGFDFAVTVAIGSVLGSVILSKNPPLAHGIAALVFLFGLQIGMAVLRSRFPRLQLLADNEPRLVMIGDQIQHDQLRKAKMTEDDLWAKLREANAFHFSQVLAVIAETTGDVSVLHATDHKHDIQPELLKGVIGADRYRTNRSS
ncbi:YetF domain-containing protein [uncultured Parasphingorhabdus sp.]|nr:YetF domain-containing protein [uncultured Parasphingorhabdus sp.]